MSQPVPQLETDTLLRVAICLKRIYGTRFSLTAGHAELKVVVQEGIRKALPFGGTPFEQGLLEDEHLLEDSAAMLVICTHISMRALACLRVQAFGTCYDELVTWLEHTALIDDQEMVEGILPRLPLVHGLKAAVHPSPLKSVHFTNELNGVFTSSSSSFAHGQLDQLHSMSWASPRPAISGRIFTTTCMAAMLKVSEHWDRDEDGLLDDIDALLSMPLTVFIATNAHPISTPAAAAVHCWHLHVIAEWYRTIRLVLRLAGPRAFSDYEYYGAVDHPDALNKLTEALATTQRQLEEAWATHRPEHVVAGSIAETIEFAAGPWSPRTHKHFPASERKRAVWLMVLGSRLADGALSDVWVSEVIPRLLTRQPDGFDSVPSFLARFEDVIDLSSPWPHFDSEGLLRVDVGLLQ